ncbi:hypothetical protein [Paenibacillus sacheonensis]|uniref:Exosporium leader peptide n=1 Tax=Paenibacillus sacheonensis TaxID=742054 RepID=A0A7X5C1G8_9BACL|nr:hypothetical protein [Paenibacillus sacheonensis]MBM7564876.1 hypothetical protein [Paenibacillus sacheonensis]NBC69424.1 hypothetical protein [Paenibacillus sacheonensis]
MGKFLDMRVSENSNVYGFPATPVTSTPALVGVIGLQTQNIAGTGTNGLIVNLAGTVGVDTSSGDGGTFIVNIQRGATTVYGGGDIIYTAEVTAAGFAPANLISFNAVDLNAPALLETQYTMFFSATYSSPTPPNLDRVGPECFTGIAMDGSVSPS